MGLTDLGEAGGSSWEIDRDSTRYASKTGKGPGWTRGDDRISGHITTLNPLIQHCKHTMALMTSLEEPQRTPTTYMGISITINTCHAFFPSYSGQQ